MYQTLVPSKKEINSSFRILYHNNFRTSEDRLRRPRQVYGVRGAARQSPLRQFVHDVQQRAELGTRLRPV